MICLRLIAINRLFTEEEKIILEKYSFSLKKINKDNPQDIYVYRVVDDKKMIMVTESEFLDMLYDFRIATLYRDEKDCFVMVVDL